MPFLLKLPREVRNKILNFVIATPITPPQDPKDASKRMEFRKSDTQKIRGWFDGGGVKYAPAFNRIDLLPTLLVNRQLYFESISVIELLTTRHCFEMDVMIVNEKELWPTWTSVPAPIARAEKVRASFRIFGINEESRGGFNGGAGGPPLITWSFYSLLARYLSLGPIGYPIKEAETGISIELLELNVWTPNGPLAPVEEMYDPFGDRIRQLRSSTSIEYLMPSSWLVEYMHHHIQRLLAMSPGTTPYGGVLFERIGRIRILLDDKLCHEWNLAEELRNAKGNDYFVWFEGQKSRFKFKKWKENAYKMRTELGLQNT